MYLHIHSHTQTHAHIFTNTDTRHLTNAHPNISLRFTIRAEYCCNTQQHTPMHCNTLYFLPIPHPHKMLPRTNSVYTALDGVSVFRSPRN